jgi:hypothetical protein
LRAWHSGARKKASLVSATSPPSNCIRPTPRPKTTICPEIGGQNIVQPIIRAAPDIERVEIGREIRRRRYELERV